MFNIQKYQKKVAAPSSTIWTNPLHFIACGFGKEVEAVNTAWRVGDRQGAVSQISARFLDGLGIVGPADFCRRRLEEYTKAGLTQPVIFPFSPDPDPRPTLSRTLKAFAA